MMVICSWSPTLTKNVTLKNPASTSTTRQKRKRKRQKSEVSKGEGMNVPIRDRLTWKITPEVYDAIRRLWINHSKAEDARDLEGLIATLSEDCVYEILAQRGNKSFEIASVFGLGVIDPKATDR